MKDKLWDVYIYGDINIDLVLPRKEVIPPPGEEWDVERMDTFIGGGAALFLLGIGKLSLKGIFEGAVGEDLYGRWIISQLEAYGIDTHLLAIHPYLKTGISISFTDQKNRSFLTNRGTNGEIDLKKMDIVAASQAKFVHMTGYNGRKNHQDYLEALQKLKEQTDTQISFDLGWDESGEWYEGIFELLPYIDVLFMNEEEAIHYSRKQTVQEAAALFGSQAKVVALKLGKKGSLAYCHGKLFEAKGFLVEAVDTTGAGDSFNAGFIYGMLKTGDVSQSLRIGNACGALSVTAYGGNTNFPTEAELYRFLESH